MRVILFITICALLSGCASPNNPTVPPGSTPDGPRAVGEAATNQTTLRVGQAWTYKDQAGQDARLVVTDANQNAFRVGAATDGEAFWEARYDVPFVGNFSASFVADYHGKRVQLLPVSHVTEWTADWSGQTMRHAAKINADGTIDVTVNNDAGVQWTYTFDPTLNWFSRITQYSPTGTVLHGLAQPVVGTANEEVRFALDQITHYHQSGLSPGDGIFFSVPATATDLWLDARLMCNQPGVYSVLLVIRGPAAPALQAAGPCMGLAYQLSNSTITLAAGQWTLEMYASTIDGRADMDGFVRTKETLALE